MPELKLKKGDLVAVKYFNKYEYCDLVLDEADHLGYYPVMNLKTGEQSKSKWDAAENVEVV